VLVGVSGAAPGIGKSTICAGLASWLSELGLSVDSFAEEEVLSRDQFAAVAAEFGATGVVRPSTILDAMSAYARWLQRQGIAVAVADSLVPFVSSLLAWGHDEDVIASFLMELRDRLGQMTVLIIYLDGDPHVALKRAADREGPGWLEWYTGKLARYQVQPAVTDFGTACAYLGLERDITVRLLERFGWRLVVIGQADLRPLASVLSECQRAILPLVTGPRRP
jgi:hypothetical protein